MAPCTLNVTGCASPGRCAIRSGPLRRSRRIFEVYATDMAFLRSSMLWDPSPLLRALTIERLHANGPRERDGLGRKADFVIAGLIVESAVNRQARYVLQRRGPIPGGIKRQVLHDPKRV